MNDWRSSKRELRGEIMKTDIFVQFFSRTVSQAEMELDMDKAFAMFRDFETRFSRFLESSELSKLNNKNQAQVSPDFFAILKQSLHYFHETGGLFDPAILPALEQEGYGASFKSERFGVPASSVSDARHTFGEIKLNQKQLIVEKPLALKIDLGGIGKGYVVDQVLGYLGARYDHVLVSAGGDIRVRGANVGLGYPYWAIGVENPLKAGESTAILLLSDKAVATSGINRRRWTTPSGQEKAHLINPLSGQSELGSIISVTVLSDCAEAADVYAKTIFLMGPEAGLEFAEEKQLPVFIVLKDGRVEQNKYLKPFLWKKDS